MIGFFFLRHDYVVLDWRAYIEHVFRVYDQIGRRIFSRLDMVQLLFHIK